MEYKEKNFNLPKIEGISEKQLEIHLALYRGYVTHVNRLYETLEKLQADENMSYAVAEVRRRLGFELDGVLNHEMYFSSIEDGPSEPSKDFLNAVEHQYDSFDNFKEAIKKVATGTRGIGWVIVSYDTERRRFHIAWVSDHELGQIALPPVYVVDMWEHAYMADYLPAEKGNYVDAYINATNWQYVSSRFSHL